jgi:hypothetical protein
MAACQAESLALGRGTLVCWLPGLLQASTTLQCNGPEIAKSGMRKASGQRCGWKTRP